jgi:hypothetical protein
MALAAPSITAELFFRTRGFLRLEVLRYYAPKP